MKKNVKVNATKNAVFALLILGSVSLLGGCASVPMDSPGADLQAKKFDTVPGKSSIYIFRNENYGSAIKTTVTLNDRVIGQTAPYTYFNVVTEPGRKKVSCLAETTSDLVLDTKPDQLYFIRQEMKMGMWAARCAVYEVPELIGKKSVNRCRMAQSKPLNV